MRLVVLGSGTLGRFRARTLARDPRVEWVGIGGAGQDRAREAARETQANAWGSVEQMLDQGPDAVIIASAIEHHAEHLAACIERRLPMLCEKPLAATLGQSAAAVAAAERAGVTLQVGFQRRFDSGFRAAHDRVASGALGTLYSIRLASHDHAPPPPRVVCASGGIFRDLHVHDFDLARWLSGEEMAEVFATGNARTPFDYFAELGQADTTGILLLTESGLPVLISGGHHNPHGHDVRAELFGSRDAVAVGLDSHTPFTRVGDEAAPPPTRTYANFLDRFQHAFVAETSAFLEVVAGERANACPGGEAVAAMRIAVAAELSQRERRAVQLEEITNAEPASGQRAVG